MLVELTRAAQSDAVDAALAYETERPNLGFRFEGELNRALEAIAENPLQFATVQDDVRRALLRVFPFSVFFLVLQDCARVFAVLH